MKTFEVNRRDADVESISSEKNRSFDAAAEPVYIVTVVMISVL